MGLSLCYELSLPATTSEREVLDIVSQLHAHATTLGFARMSPLVHVDPADEVPPGALAFPDLADFFRFSASLVSDPRCEDWYPIDTSREEAWTTAHGFAVVPGAQCEGATFGFAAPSPVALPDWPADAHIDTDWHWHCCCKTQYASVISDAHFIHCHRSLVALLDEAVRLGVGTVVHDESGYWEARDTAALLRAVHDMNGIVAAFAGALHDAIAPAAEVESAIFDHPEFEHLEMEKRKR